MNIKEKIVKKKGGKRKGAGRKPLLEDSPNRTLRFPETLWKSIDKKNTSISRTRFIIDAVKEKLIKTQESAA